jgi:phosphoribosylglycinamide formyltransferase-1
MKLAVFASGSGTNFQAVLDAIEAGDLPASAAVLISNDPDAGATDRAERHDVPTEIAHPGADDHAERLLRVLERHDTDFAALAGYLKKIPSDVVRTFRHRMLNIHPALLPAFGGKGYYGMRVHRAVIERGVRWTGATVHLVDEDYDTGPIVLQTPVPVRPHDTPQTLADRVLEVEHRLLPEALRLFAENRVTVKDRRVHIADHNTGDPM